MAEFLPNGQLALMMQHGLRNMSFQWGTSAVHLDYQAELGGVRLDSGTQVQAIRGVQESIEWKLVDVKTGIILDKPEALMQQFEVDVRYNCYGYCFADSTCWIQDPNPIIQADYELTDRENAEIMLFQEFIGYASNGGVDYRISHAVKINNDGTVSFKPGLNSLVENVPFNQAISMYNYNREIFIKRKN